MSDPLHPNGRCSCGGEGSCAWCISTSCQAEEQVEITGPFGHFVGGRAFVIFQEPVGKTGKRAKVTGAAQVRIHSIKGDEYQVQVLKGSNVVEGDHYAPFKRKDVYATEVEREYFERLVMWLWSGDRAPGKRPDAPPAIIHLATGIVCGGNKLWCGAKLETRYQEDTDTMHVLNATQDEERCNCDGCLVEFAKAQDKMAEIKRRMT